MKPLKTHYNDSYEIPSVKLTLFDLDHYIYYQLTTIRTYHV